MAYPDITFSTIDALKDYVNENIVPNNLRDITGGEHNNAANGFIDYIKKSIPNFDKADIKSSGGIISLSKPFTVIQNVVPESVSWPGNINNEYYIVNATGTDIPLASGFSFFDPYLVPKTLIPKRSVLHIAKAINNAWMQMGGGAGGGTGGIGSIALSMPDGFDVDNSPLTDNGEIAVTMAIQGLLYGTGVGLAPVEVTAPLLFEDGVLSITANTAGGVPILDGGGKIPIGFLPPAILGAVIYQGMWNATTNSPALTSGVGTKGYYYIVSADGSTNLNGITDWKIGDWVIYDGTSWGKVDNTDKLNGTGTTNFHSKWINANTLGNSIISDNGSLAVVNGNMQILATGLNTGLDIVGTIDPVWQYIRNQAADGRVLMELQARANFGSASSGGLRPGGNAIQFYVAPSTTPGDGTGFGFIRTMDGSFRLLADGGYLSLGGQTNYDQPAPFVLLANGNIKINSPSVLTDTGYAFHVTGTLGVTSSVRLSAFSGVGNRGLGVDENGDLIIYSSGGGSGQWVDESYGISYTKSLNGAATAAIINPSNGVAAISRLGAFNDVGDIAYIGKLGSGYTAAGALTAGKGVVFSTNLLIVTNDNDLEFSRDVGATVAMKIGTGNTVHFNNGITFDAVAERQYILGGLNLADNLGISFIRTSTPDTDGGTALMIIPKGAGFAAEVKSQITLFNTDYYADQSNIEGLLIRTRGANYGLMSQRAGTGVARPIFIDATGTTDPANANIHFAVNGNVGIGTDNPSTALHIVRPGAINMWLLGSAASDAYAQFLFGEGSGGGEYAEIVRYSNGNISQPDLAGDMLLNNIGQRIVLSTANIAGVYREDAVIDGDGSLIMNLAPTFYKTEDLSAPFGAFVSNDTAVRMGIIYPTWGGYYINGFTGTDDYSAILMSGYLGVLNPSNAAIFVQGWKTNGTNNRAQLSDEEQIISFSNGSAARVAINGFGNVDFINPNSGPILTSVGSVKWKIVVDDAGVLTTESV